MADIPITEFGIKNVEAAYSEVMTQPLIYGCIGLVSALAVFLIIQNYVETVNKARHDSDGKFTIKHKTELLWKLGAYTLIIFLIPVIIYFIEAILAEMQVNLITALGGEPKGFVGTVVAEMEEMQERYPTGPGLFDGITDIFAYINILFIKPFLAWIVRYLYAMALAGRYLYLLILEIVAPVAIVMLLTERTVQYFYTWVKHMIVCYLMVPSFITANILSDAMVVTLFDESYSLIAILANLFLKLFLLKQARDLVFKLL